MVSLYGGKFAVPAAAEAAAAENVPNLDTADINTGSIQDNKANGSEARGVAADSEKVKHASVPCLGVETKIARCNLSQDAPMCDISSGGGLGGGGDGLGGGGDGGGGGRDVGGGGRDGGGGGRDCGGGGRDCGGGGRDCGGECVGRDDLALRESAVTRYREDLSRYLGRSLVERDHEWLDLALRAYRCKTLAEATRVLERATPLVSEETRVRANLSLFDPNRRGEPWAPPALHTSEELGAAVILSGNPLLLEALVCTTWWTTVLRDSVAGGKLASSVMFAAASVCALARVVSAYPAVATAFFAQSTAYQRLHALLLTCMRQHSVACAVALIECAVAVERERAGDAGNLTPSIDQVWHMWLRVGARNPLGDGDHSELRRALMRSACAPRFEAHMGTLYRECAHARAEFCSALAECDVATCWQSYFPLLKIVANYTIGERVDATGRVLSDKPAWFAAVLPPPAIVATTTATASISA